MKQKIQCYKDNFGFRNNIVIDLPSLCPYCKTSFGGITIHAYLTEDSDKLFAIHMCPACNREFFSQYYRQLDLDGMLSFGSPNTYPKKTFQTPQMPERVRDISPSFVRIYNQASEAEENGLLEICGLGYRKAIEFLLKDFAVYQYPDEADVIKSMRLSACIEKYVNNYSVKKVAERAVWLGNDHAHYLNKHNDRDLSDLKALVSLSIKWIDMELETKEYIEDIQKK